MINQLASETQLEREREGESERERERGREVRFHLYMDVGSRALVRLTSPSVRNVYLSELWIIFTKI